MRLAAFVDSLREFSGFKWVKSDQLHITLKFLGDMPTDRITSLDTNFSRLGGTKPFPITLGGVGAFPSLSRVKTLWLGVEEGVSTLSRLAAFVEKASVLSGCEAERRKFHPHLTLGRSRLERGEISDTDSFEEKLRGVPSVSWTCGGFTLMKSVLATSGPIYTPIGSYVF
jgi:2'-5' RNA ligase